MTIKTLALSALFALAFSLLSACGFTLRGQVNVGNDIAPVYVASNSNSQLLSEIRSLLKRNKVELANSLQDANHKLALLKQESDRRTLSIGADANAVEYQLIETAVVAIEDKQGAAVLSPTTFTERRIIRNDPDQVVSQGEEEAKLRREMQQSLAAKIVRRLAALGKQP